ncbi:MAG: DUF1573 domain-containing protein [Polyangiaceae bacterium]|nr:DUF1573 domain-containing protein [Polyangiaceae bacterium]
MLTSILKSKAWQIVMAVGALSLALGVFGCVSKKKEAEAGKGGAPKIEFAATTHDFGKVSEGENVKFAFKVTNKGKAPLTIDNVRTSCGCAAATPKDKTIAPGASSEIAVSFDTRGRPGKNRKVITVSSNDPTAATSRLEITANVEPTLAFEARHVRLNPAYNEEQVKEVRLVGRLAKGTTLKVDEVSDRGPEVEPLPPEGDKPAGLRLKFKGKEVGTGAGRVSVSTSVEDPKQLTLRYSWQVTGNIKVMPSRPYFDAERPGLKERLLTVTSSRPDFKLTRATAQGPFKATIEKPADGGVGYAVRVVYTAEPGAAPKPKPATDKPGGESGTLLLISNDPIEPKKEVPLRVASMRGPRLGPGPGRQPGARGMPPRPMRPPPPRSEPRPQPQQ